MIALIEKWETISTETVAEDIALAFNYLAVRLDDTGSAGTVWERLLRKVDIWNRRLNATK